MLFAWSLSSGGSSSLGSSALDEQAWIVFREYSTERALRPEAFLAFAHPWSPPTKNLIASWANEARRRNLQRS